MTDYGITRFGTGFTYSESNASGVYYNSGLTATTTDYNTVNVAWSSFTPDPADGVTTNWYWVLVKSYTGTHDNPMDGIYLTGGSYTSGWATSYADVDTSVDGAQVSYSLWVFAGNGTTSGKWIFCGADYSYIVSDTGTLNTLTSWIPKAWLNSGEALGQSDGSNTLVNMLGAFAFTYDKLRLEGALLAKNNVGSLIPSQLLQYELSNFGFDPEPALGDTYHRTLIAAGNSIYKYKGTPLGVQIYTNSLTHLNNTLSISNNLLLDTDDASFESNVGRWESTGILGATPYTGGSGFGSVPPTNILTDSSVPLLSHGFGVVLTAATTPIIISLPGPSTMNDPQKGIRNFGIPVKGNTSYVFSGWVQHSGVAANITIDVSWYDMSGKLISTNTGSTVWTTTTSWKEFTSDGARDGTYSPYNAVYAALAIHLTPSASSVSNYAFDYFQFARTEYSYVYEEARRANIYLQGEKENYIPNPSFESTSSLFGDLTGWFGYNGTLSIESNTTYVYSGTKAAKLTVTGTTDAAFVTDWIAVDPGKMYTASAYVTGSSAKAASVRIEYSSQPTLDLQIKVLSDANGQYYPTTTNLYSSYGATATITNVVGNGTSVVYTGENSFQVGQPVTVTGVTPSGYNLSNKIITAVDSHTFTVTNAATGTYVSGGSATINATTLSTSTPTRISVTSSAPPAGLDAGSPVAKVHVYFPSATAGDSFWIDAVMLEDASTPSAFFSGNGGAYPANPITTQFYSPGNCWWESKARYNYMSNPSFASSATDWALSSGTSFTWASLVNPWGTHAGLLTVPSGSSGAVTATGYLPYYPAVGTDYTFSAYVKGFTGTVAISIPALSSSDAITTQVIDSSGAATWTRISCRGITTTTGGVTSIQGSIAVTGVVGQTTLYISGAQLEFGRIATDFIDPALSTTKTIPNTGLSGTGKNLYANMLPSVGGVKSSYIYNYAVKSSRLFNNLSLVIPYGVTYAVHAGKPTLGYTEISPSILPNPSFENASYWASLTGSLVQRTVSKGVLFSDTVTQGQAYVIVTNTTAATTFSLSQTTLPLTTGSYYCSTAIRPGVNAVSGTYSIDITFMDDGETVWVAPTVSKTFSQATRWNYIAGTYPAASIAGANAALITISYTSGAGNTNQAFRVDRVVFRH